MYSTTATGCQPICS